MTSAHIRALALALLVAALPASPHAQPTQTEPATLALTGTGEIAAKPDTATVTAGVVSEAETARDAMNANNEAMARVVAALKDAGLADKDIQTSAFSVQPQYVYPEPKDGRRAPPRIIGYQVSNQVSARVRDLGKLGITLDRLVSSGANQINGVNFIIDDDAKLRDKARRLAMEDVMRKAALYAEAAGVKLQRIRSIQEADGYVAQRPVAFDARAMQAEAAGAAPIETGELALRVDVSVTWEIATLP